jgi:hypothetical protein
VRGRQVHRAWHGLQQYHIYQHGRQRKCKETMQRTFNCFACQNRINIIKQRDLRLSRRWRCRCRYSGL